MLHNLQFEEVYHAHSAMVYNLALHYVQDTGMAEDITQEVFMKVYRNLPAYDPSKSAVKTWISRITINHSLDFLKSRRTSKIFNFFGAFVSPEDKEYARHSPNHPGVLAEDKETLNNLFKAINSLAPNQKTAIILVRIEDRPQREAAEIMNISIKALESLLQRARSSLQKKLAGSEG